MHACTNVVTDKTKGKKKRIYEKMKKEKKQKVTRIRAQICKYVPLSAREKKEAESGKKENKSKECSKSGLPR